MPENKEKEPRPPCPLDLPSALNNKFKRRILRTNRLKLTHWVQGCELFLAVLLQSEGCHFRCEKSTVMRRLEHLDESLADDKAYLPW